MFAGHLAVGLALKKADKKISLGYLFFAAMFADFLLGILVLVGLEQIHVPANFSAVHFLTFTFPYSHGLVASLLWSLAVFLIVKLVWKKSESTRAGIVLAVAVFSHFILDWIVHIPELPLLGENSRKLGLGLWASNMNLALALEIGLVIVGVTIYLRSVKGLSSARRYGIIGLMVMVSVLTVIGNTFATTAPPPLGAAVSWISETLLLAALAYWLDSRAA